MNKETTPIVDTKKSQEKFINPYENVGIQHNVVLTKLLNATLSMPIKESQNYVNQFLTKTIDSVSISNPKLSIYKDELILQINSIANPKKSDDLMPIDLKSSLYTLASTSTTFSMDKISQEIKSTSDSLKNKKTPKDILNEIDRRERLIRDKYTKEESQILYVYFATMRNSLTFWTKDIKNILKQNEKPTQSVLGKFRTQAMLSDQEEQDRFKAETGWAIQIEISNAFGGGGSVNAVMRNTINADASGAVATLTINMGLAFYAGLVGGPVGVLLPVAQGAASASIFTLFYTLLQPSANSESGGDNKSINKQIDETN